MNVGFLKENTRIAFSSLRANKLRTVLSLLGITIGVASLVTILSLGGASSAKMSSSFSDGGVDIITVTPARGRNASSLFNEEFCSQIASGVEGIHNVIPLVSSTNTTRRAHEVMNASVIGTVSSFGDFYSLNFDNGRWFNREENLTSRQVCVIGHDVAENLFEAGETPVGQYIKVFRGSAKSFLVVGVLESRDPTMSIPFDNAIFIPYSTYNDKLRKVTNVGTYIIKTKSGFDPVRVADDISSYLDSLVSSEGYNIFSSATLAQMVATAMASFYSFLSAIGAISLLVGGIGIMNIMLVSVAERTREIGIRKAIGAPPKAIQAQFLTESVILTLWGGMLGVIFGIVVSLVIEPIVKWPLFISIPSFVVGVGFSALVGVFFGWYPARKAASLNPVDALSRE